MIWTFWNSGNSQCANQPKQVQIWPSFFSNIKRILYFSFSTLSSGLSALATVTWKDILELKFQHIPESRKTLITKLLSKYLSLKDHSSNRCLLIDLVAWYSVSFLHGCMLIYGLFFIAVMYGGLSLGLAYSMKYIGGHVSQVKYSFVTFHRLLEY